MHLAVLLLILFIFSFSVIAELKSNGMTRAERKHRKLLNSIKDGSHRFKGSKK